MKRAKSAICVIMMMFVISACAGRTSNDSAVSMREQEEISKETEGSRSYKGRDCSDYNPCNYVCRMAKGMGSIQTGKRSVE